MRIAGATNEVATLKEAVSKAESNAAAERTEREKQEARVAEVRQDTTREKPIHRILSAACFKIRSLLLISSSVLRSNSLLKQI